ncbi:MULTISPECIES: DUF5611 family protein [unclassified Halorhabdus]|uniref:DUF5611 family protein n=1 Tax=unclassified Halorhabdus TaxID=2621901 RepID=UPI0023DC623E|nr:MULTISPECIES: DUF5611 family protein [unclassified Halorhabdus]WEL17633.1 Uncharacterized protein SVXHr_1465 [Halorhabdus sp. SVX81]WEL21512.1 Uncharacterized protein HBNXHr_1450 [Halorhabdus sp. BNX81]
MREYKMRRGEYLEDRVPDMRETVEEYFGPISGTEPYNDTELYIVEDPDNPVFERVTVGTVPYGSKKDKLALDIEERPAEEVIAEGHVDAAEDAVNVKNDFLEMATGRDAKSRRDSMKRSVEDDADAPDSV